MSKNLDETVPFQSVKREEWMREIRGEIIQRIAEGTGSALRQYFRINFIYLFVSCLFICFPRHFIHDIYPPSIFSLVRLFMRNHMRSYSVC